MRILIATVAASLLTAAAAAGVVFHSASSHPAAAKGQPATKAVPGLVWRNGTAALRLTDKPCPFDEVRTQLETEGIEPARAYVVEQARRLTTGCWSRDVGGDVVTLEPGRELGQIPIDWFRSESGT